MVTHLVATAAATPAACTGSGLLGGLPLVGPILSAVFSLISGLPIVGSLLGPIFGLLGGC